MNKKKCKAVMLDGIPLEPISTGERRRIDKRIKKNHEKFASAIPRSSREESRLDFAQD